MQNYANLLRLCLTLRETCEFISLSWKISYRELSKINFWGEYILFCCIKGERRILIISQHGDLSLEHATSFLKICFLFLTYLSLEEVPLQCPATPQNKIRDAALDRSCSTAALLKIQPLIRSQLWTRPTCWKPEIRFALRPDSQFMTHINHHGAPVNTHTSQEPLYYLNPLFL